MRTASATTWPETATPRKATMKAIVQDTYGTTEVLRLRDIPRPAPRTTRCWYGSTRPGWTGASGMS